MKHFTLEIRARGSLLIGGGEKPVGLHDSHIADAKGQPYVPASALRGALRETLEALLRGAGMAACDSGRGHTVDAPSETWSECVLDEGRPCAACRIFGGTRRGLATGARDFSSLVLGDGRCTTDDAWMLRPGVAVSRAARSAADDRLFFRRSTRTAATFEADGWLRTDDDLQRFQAAVQATTHIGSGRSRGLARVDLKVRWKDPPSVPDAVLTQRDVRVRVTLRSPTILGVPLAHDNLRETRREIPGGALRGAVGFALAGSLPDPRSDVAFQDLVRDTGGASFGFLSPIDLDTADASPTGHLPITMLHCKRVGAEHGPYDDLLDRIAVSLISDAGQVDAVQAGLRAKHCGVAGCGAPLRSAHGYRRRTERVPTRVATRAAIERKGQSVRDGALFTEVYLEPGTVFEGRIRNVPEGSLSLLATMPGRPCTLGRARGSGRGLVTVELTNASAWTALTTRGETFDAALRAFLARCRLDDTMVGRLVPITLLSPAVVDRARQGADDWARLAHGLPEALRASRQVTARRFIREGTWDQQTGTMHALEAVAGGAVYVLCLPEGQNWREHLDALAAMERDGLGERRHQGYGEAIAFDPIHTHAAQGV